MEPRPPEPVPILVGGESEAALDRAARLADGFITLPHTQEEFPSLVSDMRARLRHYGRDEDAFHVNARCIGEGTIGNYARLAEHGIASAHVSLWPYSETRLEAKLEAVEQFGTNIVVPFHGRYD